MKKIYTTTIAAAIALTAPAFAQSMDPDAWLNPETRQKLRQGMSPAQVEEVIGKPGRARVIRQSGAGGIDYEYRTADERNWLITNFLNGTLIQYSVARLTNPDRTGFENCQRPDAWGKVKANMQPEEVVEVLGEPTAKSFAGGIMPTESLVAYLYEFGEEPEDGYGAVMFGTGGVVAIMEPFCPQR